MSARRTFSGKAADPMVTAPGAAGSPLAPAAPVEDADVAVDEAAVVVDDPPLPLELPLLPHAASPNIRGSARAKAVRFMCLLGVVVGSDVSGELCFDGHRRGRVAPSGAAGEPRGHDEPLHQAPEGVEQHR